MPAEAVKVIVRCRPMNKREKDLKCKPVVFMDSKISQCSIVNAKDPNAPPKLMTFDGAYYTDSTTEAIYNEIAFPLVEGVLEGYNGTVFAYGQTGCGKSFTMQGIKSPASQRGIIPRSFEHIFEVIDSSENMKYLVHAAYLEIYNEEIRDLLGTESKKKLELKEHPDKGVHVPDLSLHTVTNTAECEALMDKGWKNRSVGATEMNADSSRSHSIFTISIEMMSTGMTGDQHIRKGKLNLVDLAGSERQSKTKAAGDRLKEATNINLSLSALGNVISALVDGKSKHIPYRDSKLTRLLQDSLGGNTKTMMVACLSPADNNYDETLSTLRYANRAKNIKNKPKINEDPKDAMLREYQDEITKLKALLEQKGPLQEGEGFDAEALLEEERQKMREQYDLEMNEMRQKMESEKQTKEKMANEVELMKQQYEEKLKALEQSAKAGTLSRQNSNANVLSRQQSVDPQKGLDSSGSQPILNAAMLKLKKLQEEMIEGGKRAGDKGLKEKRKQKKKAAENRIKALGEALGHVDDEDGVLLKVYDDIQEELRVKTEALKKAKQRIKVLNSEINDLQQEFEDDRTDYLDTIRKQDQQLILLQQILDKVQPTMRKDSNYSNIEKIKQEAKWNDEVQKWAIPDLVIAKTKLPPAEGATNGFADPIRSSTGVKRWENITKDVKITIDGSLKEKNNVEVKKGFPDENNSGADVVLEDLCDVNNSLQQKLAKSEEEDVVGNYFKPHRASRLVAQAKETQRNLGNGRNSGHTNSLNLNNNPNLSSSFNSGLNNFGLKNSYASGIPPSIGPGSLPGPTGMNGLGSGGSNNRSNHGSPQFNVSNLNSWNARNGKEIPSWLQSSNSQNSNNDIMRKPTRLEAMPAVDVRKNNRKRSTGPLLNTMGTF